MILIGTSRIGETIRVALDAMTGDPTTAISAVAKMQKLTDTVKPELDTTFTPLDMAVSTYTAGGDNEYPGWLLEITHTVSATLEAGYYGIDLKAVFSGPVHDITEETGMIRLTKAVVG